jgi:hypothetical protein
VFSSNRFFLPAATALAVIAAGTAPSAWATTPTIPYGNPGTYNPVDVSFTAAATGDIIATFIGKSNALYENKVGLLDNGVLTSAGFGLDNRTSTGASTFDMGLVHKGDTLVFVMDNITLGEDLYSDASMNAAYDSSNDTLGHNHVYATPYYNPTYTYVGFEDQRFPGADFNYNDSAFLFTDVAIAPAVPEPQTAALLFAGLAAAGALARRRRG